jgi:hypothetical protein
MMADDLKAVQAFAAGKEQDILVGSPLLTKELWKTRQFRANYAHAKLLGVVLAHHTPLDLLNGQALDVGKALAWSNGKEYHHFFPQDYLKVKGVSASQINSLANFVMLSSASNKRISNRAPSNYLPEVIAAAGENLDRWLQSNLISKVAFERALADDFAGFIEQRSADIHHTVSALC